MKWFLVAIALLVLVIQGCTPQSTRRFEPTLSVNVEEEIARQSGEQKESGNDCYEVYEAMAEECGYSRSLACQRIRRARDRIGKVQPCKVHWSRAEINGIMRALGRR